MMKRLVSIFLLSLYALAMLKPVLPFIEYAANKDYISEVLCINKDKVEMQCNGKCHLTAQLKKQNEKKEDKIPAINLEDYPISEQLHSNSSIHRFDMVSNIQLYDADFYHFTYLHDIHHPPEFNV